MKVVVDVLKFPKRKKIYRYLPRTKKEKCESGHHQMMFLSDKEVEGRKRQWQGVELCQKMHITKS